MAACLLDSELASSDQYKRIHHKQEQSMSTKKSEMLAKVPPLKIKDAFKGKFQIGTVLGDGALQGRDPASLAMATTHFDALTPENSMKLTRVQPGEGRFDFTEADRFVHIAEECGATVVGHVLVWREQAPAWFFEDSSGQPADRKLVLSRLRKHISKVVGRYKGRIRQWDVVNEAISDVEGEYLWPTSPWFKALGEDYIAEAFRAAHKADPAAILIYNDYNIERNAKRVKALQLLKSLLDKGVPIHAVGIQGHWRVPDDDPDFSEVEEAIEQFGALGLKVIVTELDIGVLPPTYGQIDLFSQEVVDPVTEIIDPYATGLPDEVAQKQMERYRQAFEIFLRHRDVIDRVTIWGIQDGDSWFNNYPVKGRTDYPLLFDRHYKPKPAFFAVMEAVQAPKRTPKERVPQATAGATKKASAKKAGRVSAKATR
jgi:endo-1,4-beta-xylanase